MDIKNLRKRSRRRRETFICRAIALGMAASAVALGMIGGSVAWLTDQSSEVKNEFSASDINVELTETTTEFKMIPGWTIDKDPTVTVKAGSEDCWVFIKVEEKGVSYTPEGATEPTEYTFDNFIEYKIDEANWKALGETEYPGVYYCMATDITKDRSIKILGPGTYVDKGKVTYTWSNNEVLTKPEVTKEMMEKVTENNQPTLSFTAYAVQLWKANKITDNPATAQFTAEEAWKKTAGFTAGTT